MPETVCYRGVSGHRKSAFINRCNLLPLMSAVGGKADVRPRLDALAVDGDWAAGTVHRRHPQAGAERRRAAQQTVIDSTIAMNQRSVVQLIKHQVIHLAPSASVREAAQLMSENHIGALVVMDEGRLAGIFTERDALNRILAEGRDPDSTPLSEVMTRAVA